MLNNGPITLAPVDTIAHIIQVALTPVFLLSGIAALLNVFSSRLARVSDRCHVLAAQLEMATPALQHQLDRQLSVLHRRSLALDVAVLLGTFGGGSTCAAALLLFVGTLRDATTGWLLYASFGLALIATVGALLAFMVEMLMASRGLRQDAAERKARVRARQAGSAAP